MTGEANAERTLHLTWAALILATLLGFGTAEFFEHPLLAVAVIVTVAGIKVLLILRNFMELKKGPVAFQLFFALWVVGCVVAITSLYAPAQSG